MVGQGIPEVPATGPAAPSESSRSGSGRAEPELVDAAQLLVQVAHQGPVIERLAGHLQTQFVRPDEPPAGMDLLPQPAQQDTEFAPANPRLATEIPDVDSHSKVTSIRPACPHWPGVFFASFSSLIRFPVNIDTIASLVM